MTLSDAFLLSPVEPAPGASSAAHDRARPVQRGWLLALVTLALALRAAMAWRLQALSDDGFYYLSMGNALDSGDYDTAFQFLSINVYPAILAVLHGLGLDWMTAGKLWGVLVGSALVLPLYGLVRRVFGDRNALVACFLYAVHPNFIELAVEPIREVTFWFSWTLCLWLTDRACHTQSLRWFAAAGAAATLAVHTRVEGWFLVIPLAGWCFAAWRRNPASFRRLAAGAMIWAAVTPLAISAVNLTLLRGRDHWEWGRMHEVLIVRDLVLRTFQAHPAPTVEGMPVIVPVDQHAPVNNRGNTRRIPFSLAFREYFRQFPNGVGPLYVVLLASGLILWRRTALQSDVLPLVVTAALVSAAIGVRLMFLNDINGRYFLTSILCLMPFQAHALRWLAAGALNLASRWRLPSSRGTAAASVMVAVALAGGIDALSARHVRRSAELAFGLWLREHLPTSGRIAVDRPAMRLGYVLRSDLPTVLVNVTPDVLDREFARAAPDLLILTMRRGSTEVYANVLSRAEELGMRRLTLADAPQTATDFAILLREKPEMRQVLRTSGEPPTPR